MDEQQDRKREYMRGYAKRRYDERTPEEIERSREYMRNYMNKRNHEMTPEEREAFNAVKREYARERRASETPEQREKRLAYAREAQARRKAANPEAVREANRRYVERRKEKEQTDSERRAARLATGQRFYAALRLSALVRYSGDPAHCVCCGERHVEFLGIDHVNGGGTQHRKALKGASIYLWLRKNGYPEGFRTLCANCNFATRLGPCPHEREKVVPFERPQGGCS